MHTVYGVAERITVLDVQKARLRVLFALRLVSGATIFKSAGKAQLLRAAHKLILNVSERTTMFVVISSSDVFAQQKLAVSKCTRMYIC